MSLIFAAVALLTAGWLWTPDEDRARLEARYANGPGDFVQVAGVRLHVRDTGPRDAPVVILIHGFASSLHTWEAWSPALSARFRVIRFDLPGSGLSEPDPAGDYSDARSVEVVGALMDYAGAPRASLVGNSIGGRIAWRYAAKYPARVERLVLVSPDGFASPGFEYGKKPDVPAALGLMRHFLPANVLRMNLAAAYADPAVLTDALLARYHDLLRAPGVRAALLERMAQTVLADPVPLLRGIEAPTLLVWGDRDALIPVANAADYLRALPHATLATFNGVGHLPQEESPALSVASVIDFLGAGRAEGLPLNRP